MEQIALEGMGTSKNEDELTYLRLDDMKEIKIKKNIKELCGTIAALLKDDYENNSNNVNRDLVNDKQHIMSLYQHNIKFTDLGGYFEKIIYEPDLKNDDKQQKPDFDLVQEKFQNLKSPLSGDLISIFIPSYCMICVQVLDECIVF